MYYTARHKAAHVVRNKMTQSEIKELIIKIESTLSAYPDCVQRLRIEEQLKKLKEMIK